MANIEITKRVDLEFLGERYKGSHIVFKSIAVSEYDKYIKKSEEIKNDNSLATSLLLDTLKDRFVSGEFVVEGDKQTLEAKDIEQLDINTVITCFQELTGQISPKDE